MSVRYWAWTEKCERHPEKCCQNCDKCTIKWDMQIMTNEDAIDVLTELKKAVEKGWYEISLDETDAEAFELAIEALRKVAKQ